MKRSVIIVGAGIGGLSAAVRLLNRGYDVTIYEKQKSIGGRVNQFKQGPFTFDLTASILMNRDAYEDVFRDANLCYEEYLEFLPIDPTYRAFYPDGSHYDFSNDLVSLIHTLESFLKGDSIGYMKLLAEVYKRYTITNEHFLQKSFENLFDFFNPSTLLEAMKTKALTTSHELISTYMKDEKLIRYLCYQAFYVGISPYEGSSLYTLVPVISQLFGLWHLKGGMYSFVKALEKAIGKLGGRIVTDYVVDEILVSNCTAVGIRANGNEPIYADIILCNADFPYAMNSLVKNDINKGKHNRRKLESMHYSCATFILYLGLKKRYPALNVHNLYLNEHFKENIDFVFSGKLPDNPSFYFYCPTRIDQSMISTEGECVSVVMRVPNLFFKDIAWDGDTIGFLKSKAVSALKTITGLEDIEDNIVMESYLTPEDLRNDFNSYGGTAFGLSPMLTQTNYFRPHLKSKSVNRLYFVGNSVHPGSGVSIVLLSSKLVVSEILKDTLPNS